MSNYQTQAIHALELAEHLISEMFNLISANLVQGPLSYQLRDCYQDMVRYRDELQVELEGRSPHADTIHSTEQDFICDIIDSTNGILALADIFQSTLVGTLVSRND